MRKSEVKEFDEDGMAGRMAGVQVEQGAAECGGKLGVHVRDQVDIVQERGVHENRASEVGIAGFGAVLHIVSLELEVFADGFPLRGCGVGSNASDCFRDELLFSGNRVTQNERGFAINGHAIK